LFVGSAAVFMGGMISIATANASGAVLAGGAVGGIGTAITSKKRDKFLKDDTYQSLLSKLEQSVKDLALKEYQFNNNIFQKHLNFSLEQQNNKYEKLSLEIKDLKDIWGELDNHQKLIQVQVDELRVKSYKNNQIQDEHELNCQTTFTDNICDQSNLIAKDSFSFIGQQNNKLNASEAWLNSQGIKVDRYKERETTELSKSLAELSLYLGSNYTSLKSFHNKLAHSSETGSRFRFSLQSRTQEDIRIHTSFASLLQRSGYLSNYYYARSEKVMNVTPHRKDNITSFLWGDWFEKYIFEKITNFLKTEGLTFEFLINPEVTFPNGDSYELDLFMLADGIPLWIECKAGRNYDAYLQQYSRQREIIALPKQNALIATLLLEKNETNTRTELWDVTVVNPETLLDAIKTALNISSEEKVAFAQRNIDANNTEISDSTPSMTTCPLVQAKIKPVTAHRKKIISELVSCFQASTDEVNYFSIRSCMLKNLASTSDGNNSSISSTSISYILKTLLHSTCFLDNRKNAIKSINEPIRSFVSLDVSELDKLCIENYILRILEFDLNYFEKIDNVKKFETVVGGTMPDKDRIEALRSLVSNKQ
jgi:hypothetical protein